MRSELAARGRLWLIVLCFLMLMVLVPRSTYAALGEVGGQCNDPTAECFSHAAEAAAQSVPEPDPGLVGYAMGFLGVGIAAARLKFSR